MLTGYGRPVRACGTYMTPLPQATWTRASTSTPIRAINQTVAVQRQGGEDTCLRRQKRRSPLKGERRHANAVRAMQGSGRKCWGRTEGLYAASCDETRSYMSARSAGSCECVESNPRVGRVAVSFEPGFPGGLGSHPIRLPVLRACTPVCWNKLALFAYIGSKNARAITCAPG